jgi:endonuclease/exonuclease/phosphatase family metal-dependent hydrolase
VIDLTVATWNVEWRAPGSVDAALIRERLDAVGADIICLTEAYANFTDGEGHLIESEPDYGYPVVQGRRKVLLWSREPWAAVDRVGQPDLPPGRFVAGRTMTAVGPIDVVGVCIPWREAHVRSGTRDRTLWQDHLAYLNGLRGILAERTARTLVMGDFNQRVPRQYSPPPVFAALESTLRGFRVATAGTMAPIGKAAIDHVAHTDDLEPLDVSGLSNRAPDGREISDHFGVAVRLRASSSGTDGRSSIPSQARALPADRRPAS